MAIVKEEHEHLAQLASAFHKLADRTERARTTAVGLSDVGPGVAHDPALNEQIDWFYRRWIQQVESLRFGLDTTARALTAARKIYESTDAEVCRAAMGQLARRVGADQ